MNEPVPRPSTSEQTPSPLQMYRAQAWEMITSLEMDLIRIHTQVLNKQIPITEGIKQMEEMVSEAIESMSPKQEAVDPLVGKMLRLLDEVATSYQVLWQMLGKTPAGSEIEEQGIDRGSDKGFDEA